MRTSAAPRLSSRPLAATAVLALVLVGLVPSAAHAEVIPGGSTRATAKSLPMTDRTATFTTSNVDAPFKVIGDHWNNLVWYSFQPHTSGQLSLLLTALPSTPPYDTTLEFWTAEGDSWENDDCGAWTRSCLSALPVVGGETYLIGVGGFPHLDGSSHTGQGTATLTLTLTAPPTPPQDVAVVPGDGSAVVTWAPPSHPYGDLDEYAVYFQEGSMDADLRTVLGDQTSVELTGLVNGREYLVWIVAHNENGWSAATDPVSFTPRAPSTVEITVDVAAPASGDRYCVYIDVLSHDALVAGETFDLTKNSTSFPGLSTGTTWAGCWGDPVGDYVFTATFPGTAAIAPSSATVTVSVSKLGQTVTLAPLPASPVYGDAPVTLVASSSQSLPVTFSGSGACTVAGDQLSFTGVGECSVTASQAGTSEVHAASQTRTTMVAKRPQALAVSGLPPLITGNGQFAVTGASSAGLPVALAASGACTVFGGVVTVTDVGTCTVTATQAGDAVTLPGTATVTATIAGTPATASLWIGFGVGDTAQGSPVVVTGSGLRPGMALTLTVYSTPTQVGATSASVLGTAVTTGELPALEAGEHRLVARGTALDGSRVTKVVRFAVDDAGIVTRIGAPAPLADSGIQTAPAPLALLWLVLGLCLIATRRTLRRRTTS